ncbi:MAG: Holliday junction branch migration protein RuvA [Gammaproteobacteria bacterium]|nr:Holliday junction branch migration protein RuvA [Gammaproteobacteria bacterium]
MIGRLHGILLEKQPPYLLIDVHGVGYEVQVSMNTFCHPPPLNQQVILHTHHVVREDASLLFGFLELRERTLFRHLIKVNGVGPKMALAILSTVEPDHFLLCVQNQDIKSLTRLPGVGKKTAERLLIDMKDRLKDWSSNTSLVAETAQTAGASNSAIGDAIDALVSLGYKAAQAQHTISQIAKEGMASADLIRLALQTMAK